MIETFKKCHTYLFNQCKLSLILMFCFYTKLLRTYSIKYLKKENLFKWKIICYSTLLLFVIIFVYVFYNFSYIKFFCVNYVC